MTLLTALGELPEAVLGLTFGMGCALGLGFLCLRVLVGFVTRDGNGLTDPTHSGSIVLLGAAVGPSQGETVAGLPVSDAPTVNS